jgi:predicted dehydrogenase
LSYFRGEHLQNLDGFPSYWLGYPPMHYVTHALSPALALAGTRVESVRCLGSSPLTPDRIGVAGPGYGTEAALFQLSGDLVANVTMSFFQLGRSYLEGFSVYGDEGALEWPQLEGGPMKEFAMRALEPGRRGRAVDERDVRPEGAPGLLPESLRPFTSGGHGGSHPHLVHEFVSSIVEERRPRVDARTAATWTAPGICAHQSALKGGAEVLVPDYGTS